MSAKITFLLLLSPFASFADEGDEVATPTSTDKSMLRGFNLETFGDASRIGVHFHSGVLNFPSSRGLTETKLKFFLSGPVNKDDSKTELATLDSLVNDFKIGFQYERRLVATGGGFPTPGSGTPPVFDLALNASVGYRSFDYLNPVVGEDKLSEDTFPWEVGFSVATAPRSAFGEGQMRFRLGYKYQRGYKENETVSRLGAADAMGFQMVEQGARGKPLDDDTSLLFAEIIYTFDIEESGVKWVPTRFAFVPRYTYDFESETSGVDMPVFFLVDDKSNLTGGLRLGWRDDTDDLTVGFFIGTAFDFWNNDN